MIKNLHKLFLIIILTSTSFAGTLGKSHSAELLSRGRFVPMAISDNTFVTAIQSSSGKNEKRNEKFVQRF